MIKEILPPMNNSNIMKRLLINLILLFVFLVFPSPSGAATVRVEVIQSRSQYPAGGSYPIQFLVRVNKPWYLHGTGTGEEGLIPTLLTFPDSPALKVGGIKFPAPDKKRFEYTKNPVEVFSGEFRVRARVIISRKAPTTPPSPMTASRLMLSDMFIFVSPLSCSEGEGTLATWATAGLVVVPTERPGSHEPASVASLGASHWAGTSPA